MSTMIYDRFCAQETPRKIEWAGQGVSNSEHPLHSKMTFARRLLALPRFKDVDIIDLIRLAEERGTCPVSDRASAIAVLVGNKPLDSAEFKVPLTVALSPGMPKYL